MGGTNNTDSHVTVFLGQSVGEAGEAEGGIEVEFMVGEVVGQGEVHDGRGGTRAQDEGGGEVLGGDGGSAVVLKTALDSGGPER